MRIRRGSSGSWCSAIFHRGDMGSVDGRLATWESDAATVRVMRKNESALYVVAKMCRAKRRI